MRPPSTIVSQRPHRWRAAARLAGCTAAVAAALWASACSLLYDLDTAQCSTNLDCTNRGEGFEFLICIDSLCQVDPEDCTTHAECLDRPGQFGATACVDRRCEDLTTAECPVVLPQDDLYLEHLREDPQTLILGGFAQIEAASLTGLALRNYDLALTELYNEQQGLPGASTPRRVIMVACDNSFESSAELDASMVHLADTLKVPGIASALLADDLQRAFQSKGLPNEIFFMSPLDADSTLTTLQDSGLVWFTLPGSESISRAYKPLLERTLAHLSLTEPARVALVVATDVRFLDDMAATVTRDVVFNQKSAVDNLAEGNFLQVQIISINTNMTADLTGQIQSLLDFKPHVIIAAADREFLDGMVPLIENRWDEDARTQPPPFYLLSPFHFGNPGLSTVRTLPGVRQRLVGVNAPSSENQTLLGRYRLAWDAAYEETTSIGNRHNYDNYYDAAYYLIYAAAARNPNGLTSGQDLRLGMNELLAGNQVFGVGKDEMSQAFFALSQDDITLNGLLGPPNWNRNGARFDTGSLWCMPATGLLPDVVRYDYDEASGTITGRGEFPATCIDGF